MRLIEKQARTLRLFLLGLVAATVSVLAPPQVQAQEVDTQALKMELEKARKELDAAAQKLAELNVKLFESETSGASGGRPMLGVLIPEKPQKNGIKLLGVTPNGGAAQAGLKAGDLLLAVNGQRLDGGDNANWALTEAMSPVLAGDTVGIEYERDGEIRMADVTTQARGAYVKKFEFDFDDDIDIDIDLSALKELEALAELEALEELEALGGIEGIEKLAELEALSALSGLADAIAVESNGQVLELRRVDGDLASYFGVEEGVLVMAAPEASPLKAGDVLLSLDGDPVDEVGGAIGTLAAASESMESEVLRDGRRREVTLEAGQAVFSAPSLRLPKGIRIQIDVDDDENDAKDADNGP